MTQDFSSVVGGLAPGEQIAGYQIEAPIGRGGMAVVYRALDLRLGRQVALKVLAPHLGEDEAFRQRFIRESRAAAGVDHPHIIPVFEAGEADGVLFIAMRYVSYGDVRMLIDREGRLTTARTAVITAQVASALDAAHARGLVHRDVKPGNILLAESGANGADHVYLSDFGLSKHSLAASTLTATGQFMGTLDYVSPEQIQGHPADGRADQYALACTAVEMLSGSPPFRRDESMALLWAQLEAPPPPLTERRPDLPPAVDAVIGTALAKSPADRYPTCMEFASALRAACEAGPASTRAPESAYIRTPPIAVPPPGADQPWANPVPVTNPQRQPGAQSQRPPTDHAAAPAPAAFRWDAAGNGTGSAPADRGTAGERPARPAVAQPRDYRPAPRPRQSRGVGGRFAAFLIGVAVVALLVGFGYKLLHHSHPGSNTSVTQPRSGMALAGDPAAVVREYFAAINHHRYRLAWKLVGGGTQGQSDGTSFQQFEAGFAGTLLDRVTIVSTSGDTVTARLRALQDDDTVKFYQGTYTVTNGIILESNVQQTNAG
jgi:serine/threonine protein kinase